MKARAFRRGSVIRAYSPERTTRLTGGSDCLIFGLRLLAELLHVEFRIDCVEVFGVKVILNDSQPFAEALIVHDFALTQEADWVQDIRVVAETDDVIVGRAGFLLCCNHIRTTCD